jgi:hypothetical protein
MTVASAQSATGCSRHGRVRDETEVVERETAESSTRPRPRVAGIEERSRPGGRV